ncbi:GDSL-type esterase/lipase family protein [Aciduricibacillus chroicocephali]|uniref:GDSL-type esterase/lipase family protein n=1 Tax=Aciduricibacillus chroicocephali TaxID=3054939 RepID=A0ABY9KTU2_9BACI|nr:GDSL-type esterase/lipase family protein [Bacillaceae bacterium 44XB]
MKKYYGLMLIALLLFLCPAWEVSASAGQLNYVALGDSLAAGMTPQGGLNRSYADMLASQMKKEYPLMSFDKGFSIPGYTTKDVLKDIRQNVNRNIKGFGYKTNTISIQDAIQHADLITITAGANDMFEHVKVNKKTRGLDYDEREVALSLQETKQNLQKIESLIKSLNPDAKIFVMGYYNPFPYLAKEQQPRINQVLKLLNKEIAASTEQSNVVFVRTGAAIAKDYETYIPNPRNIHLSLAGYSKVADLFWEKMRPYALMPNGRAGIIQRQSDKVGRSSKLSSQLTNLQIASLLGHSLTQEY